MTMRRREFIMLTERAGVSCAPTAMSSGDRVQFSASTASEIGTPLVSTSYTAERARDCSTISRSLSGEASPLILKLMARIARLPHFAGVILACGCLIGMLGFGPRSGMGFLLTPMSSAHSWGRDVFALALAIQMLLWGAAQPFAGAIADRFGAALVLSVGAVLYALGLAAMAYAGTPAMLHLSAGVMIGFGLAGSSFTVVIGAFGKLMPPQWRSLAFGAGTAAGSFGQFLFSPLAVALIDGYGWRHTLVIFAAIVLLIIPLSLAFAAPRTNGATAAATAPQQSLVQALTEALGHRSYWLLVLGFFTCGFQIFFIAVHLPAYLVDRGLAAEIGGWTLGVIGLFNMP